MKSPTQRAVLRAQGEDTYTAFILLPAAQDYELDLAIPVDMQVASLATRLGAGTLDLTVKKVTVAGVASNIAGLVTVGVTVARLTTTPTNDGSEAMSAGQSLRITVANIAGPPTDLAVTVKMRRV